MKKSLIFKTAAIIVGFSFHFCAFAQTVTLVGSDIVGEKISNAVMERIKERKLDVKVEMLGTRQALDALKKGEADIAILAITDGHEKLEGYQYVPYTHQIAVILVNSSNPIDEISTAQLGQIFGSGSTKAETWQNLGLSNVASVKNIQPIATSLKESLALELFKHKSLGGSNISLKVDIKPNTAAVAEAVKNTSNSIAVASFDPQKENVKVLAVSASDKQNSENFAFKPTVDNVHNGDYPLTLTFSIVYKPENVAKIKPVLQILFDDNVVDLLAKGGLMPAPRNFIRSYLLGLDIGK